MEAAFGTSSTAATTHYIQHGFAEGRNDDPPTGFPPGFDGLQYIASHPDLIRRWAPTASRGTALSGPRQSKSRETDTFDQAQYLANYPDLQAAFGNDGSAASVHYIQIWLCRGPDGQ